MNRKVILNRKTNETDISVSLNINGTGKREINTPVGFLNHMLDLFAKGGLFDHTVEDIGICLGETFAKALGDKKGINRYGFFVLPMDKALATIAIDFAGRYSFRFDCDFKREKVGDLSTELIKHFWGAFAQNAKVNLFIKVEYGENDHHKIEAIFKATARAIRMACELDKRAFDQIPSTKGKL